MEKIHLNDLIKIVENGGCVKTGIDIFNDKDVLLLEKDVRVEDVGTLEHIKESGITELPVLQGQKGGVWDRTGELILFKEKNRKTVKADDRFDLESKLRQIKEERNEAARQYKKAHEAIKKVFSDIKNLGGVFDTGLVERTVRDLISYVGNNRNSVAHLINEILSYDEYLHNHSVNVCILATAVLEDYNARFEEIKIDFLSCDPEDRPENIKDHPVSQPNNNLWQNDHEISVGFFLHDVGKVLIDENILKKEGTLTPEEFNEIRKHSYEKGLEILQKNNIRNIFAQDIVAFHHGPLYPGEEGCYPDHKICSEVPAYVKICKLTDIYDARTSKRCYKEAQNPAGVMTEIFTQYVNKDKSLQMILHSFINVIGICPPGSIVLLNSGQLAYVLDSKGPLVVPFTDNKGETLKTGMDPIELNNNKEPQTLSVDKQVPITFPVEVYQKLPPFLRTAVH